MLDNINIEYLALLFAPFLLWSTYHYYKDRHRPEPIFLLLFTAVLGYGSAYIGLYLYQLLDVFSLRYDAHALAQDSPMGLFIYAIFVIGPIEELAKCIPFLCIIIRFPHFDEPLDGVIYASFIALGFSLHENQYYLASMEGGAAVGRAIAAPMVHVLFASIWGYAYGYADQHGINRTLATAGALVIAMFLHGLYDFFALSISAWANIVPPIIILIVWLARMYAIREDTE